MGFTSIRYLVLAGLLALGSCIEPYTINTPAAAQTYLVVDGFINTQGSTVIKLTRTQALAAKGSVSVEPKATVYIQDDLGRHYPLTESPAGTYSSPTQTLDPTRKYQLSITTAKGRAYLSDLIEAKTTPPIDRVSWKLENQGLQVYVSAHDPASNTHYYRWDYSETWAFTAAYFSVVTFKDTNANPPAPYVVPRTEDIYHCWHTEPSTSIKQNTTATLSQDVVSDYPLQFLAFPSERFQSLYSILVRQYAQTQAEYDYWEILRKNTESVGTINDPLPSQLTGNVHSLSDSSEPVLGFVSAHSVVEQRLFIARDELPKGQLVYADAVNDGCRLDTIPKDKPAYMDDPPIPNYALMVFRRNILYPVAILPSGHDYTVSTLECIDCRTRGTNVKPSFWP
ncbi:DUF4249 domain-containing protein [Hymenobacter baengnokdamensis]|uniref:DUF4249 domain-containing protein n=1 Tax=Hymenobacter baengnokdamensis TaxID=2615203 RepID=UPI001246DCCB|nr:DUF4249 domain-containing protein [Hymenobacter baengnokdamensis]